MEFYNDIRKLFTENFDKLVSRKVGASGFTLVWDSAIGNYLLAKDANNNPIPLTASLLPENIMTLDEDNNWIPLSSIIQYNFQTRGVHALISGNNGEIGVLPLSRIQEMQGKMPDGVFLGINDPQQGLHRTAIINDPNGYLLNGIVSLKNRQFVIDNDWYQSQTENNLRLNEGFDENDPHGIFTLDNSYRSLILSTGDHVSIIFQKQIVNFVPIESYNPLFPGFDRVGNAISFLKKLRFELPSINREAYGILTSEAFYNIFYEIMDPRLHVEDDQRKALMSLIPFLPQLNGHINSQGFITGLSLKEINHNIKSLVLTQLEMLKFSWKKQSGEIRLQTFKEWLNLIYDKVLSYPIDGLNAEILSEQKELEKFTRMSDDASFTKDEVKLAQLIFASATKLFGHFTIRLILSGMVDFNIDKTIRFSFRLKLDDLTTLHNQIRLGPPRLAKEGPIANYHVDKLNIEHLMGILILNSRIYLPSPTNSDNKEDFLSFPIGPLIGIDQNVRVTAKTLNTLSWRASQALKEGYERNHGIGHSFDLRNRFVESQTNLYRAIERVILRTVNNYFEDTELTGGEKIEKRKWLSNKLLHLARTELFIGKIQTESGRVYLRSQIEKFLSGPNSFGELEFFGVPALSGEEDFKLKILRSDLEGINFNLWGETRTIIEDFPNLRNTLLSTNIIGGVSLMEDIIKDIGNSKVRIFPMVDSKKNTFGYQYVHTTSSLEQLRLNKISWLPKNPSYFDIDLSGDPNSDTYIRSKYKLIHIFHLLIAQNTLFVVKSEGSQYDDGEMIFAFDFTGFINKDQIYSAGRNHVLNIDRQSSDFYNKKVFDDYKFRWDLFWRVFGFTSGSKDSDFWIYEQIIVNSVGAFGAYLHDVLSKDTVAN